MKTTLRGLVSAGAVLAFMGTASAQSNYQYQYEAPTAGSQAQPGVTYQTLPPSSYGQGATTYGGTTAGTSTYGQPTTTYGGSTYGQQTYGGTGYPQPQPYYPPTTQPQQPTPGYPTVVYPTPDVAPSNPNPIQGRGEVSDTDAWTFSMARYYPAIRACLRNTTTKNPVIANIQERRDATIMLIGQGGTTEYQVCRTGLNGTRVREGKEERGLPPAFYAPLGTSFTVSPERPFQPVVDTDQRLLGWIVRTTPVRLDVTGGRGFDGQFIRPVTVNPTAQ